MLTQKEKLDIVDYISGGIRYVKPIFENDVIEGSDDDEKWAEVRCFLDECASVLQEWIEDPRGQ